MTFSLHSRADVATARPGRWGKQLVSHLSNKVAAASTPRGDELSIGAGLGVVRAESNVLVLEAHANDGETLANVEDVLARHLTRFGEKDGLVVDWVRGSTDARPAPLRTPARACRSSRRVRGEAGRFRRG